MGVSTAAHDNLGAGHYKFRFDHMNHSGIDGNDSHFIRACVKAHWNNVLTCYSWLSNYSLRCSTRFIQDHKGLSRGDRARLISSENDRDQPPVWKPHYRGLNRSKNFLRRGCLNRRIHELAESRRLHSVSGGMSLPQTRDILLLVLDHGPLSHGSKQHIQERTNRRSRQHVYSICTAPLR